MMLELAHPKYLWFLTLLIPYAAWYFWKRNKKYASLEVSSITPYVKSGIPFRAFLLHGLFLLRLAALGLLIIVLARPQNHDKWEETQVEGTDIVLALDISSSMLAQDFTPDRFEAAKQVASSFINGRQSDNIGLVIFAGESYTAVPMTTDHSVLLNAIQKVKMGIIEDRTAIGDGLITAINRIKNGQANSKSIILLTDGSNNWGKIYPSYAAEFAKNLGIKVYTIGVGRNGTAPTPVAIDGLGNTIYEEREVVIDEETLKDIANVTNGKYFRATDNKVLSQIFDEIDSLEKTVIDVKNFNTTEDIYSKWAWLALILLLAELLIRNSILRTLP